MWFDLSTEIRERMDDCLPLYKHAAAIVADPAAEVVAICPDSRSLFLKTAGELGEPAKQELDYFHHVRDKLTPEDFVFIKHGIAWKSITHPATEAVQTMQRAIGGPNALTNSLVGGALGGLGGYAVGTIYDRLVPRALKRMLPGGDKNIGETNMARTLGVLGAGAGGSFGVFRGATNLMNGHSLYESALGSSPWHNYPNEPRATSPLMAKAAESAGALFVPSIPVDAFNKAVWNDVDVKNPFGSKSSWGDNSQPMSTPPYVAATMGGLVSAAGAARNSSHVSPWDVARVAAGMGVGGAYGAVTGLMAGKMLGALAGLTPEAQKSVQQTGLWAGVLTGLTKSLF